MFHVELAPLGGIFGPLKSDLGVFWPFRGTDFIMGILKIWDNFLGPQLPILKFTFLESLRNLWLFGINKKDGSFFSVSDPFRTHVRWLFAYTDSITHESVYRCPYLLLNEYLCYDKLWGPSQRVVTLLFPFFQIFQNKRSFAVSSKYHCYFHCSASSSLKALDKISTKGYERKTTWNICQTQQYSFSLAKWW